MKRPPPTTYVPTWEAALEEFVKANFYDGQVILHSWFYKSLSIDRPTKKEPHGEAIKKELAYLGGITILKNALLEQHKVMLVSVTSVGYRICPPSEQTGVSIAILDRNLAKSFDKANNELINIKVRELTDAQIRENTDARVRVSMLRQITLGAPAPRILKNE